MSEEKVLETLNILNELGYASNGITRACKDGYLKVVQYLYKIETTSEDIHQIQKNICTTAAEHGHFHILKWASEMDFSFSDDAILVAISNKHNDIVKWLYDQTIDFECDSHYPCEMAAVSGNFEILKWMHETNRAHWHVDVCKAAAESGDLHILQWLREQNCPWDEEVCTGAAENNHLHILQWARSQQCPWNVYTAIDAAINSHFDVLRWALGNGCPLTSRVYEELLYYNCNANIVEILELLYEHKCPMNESLCSIAAETYPLNVLQWLRDHGCVWDETTSYNAALNGRLPILKWALDNGCPYDHDEIIECAIIRNHFNVAQFCVDRGISLPASIFRKVFEDSNYTNFNFNYPALWWVLSKGAEMTCEDKENLEKERFNDNNMPDVIHHYHALSYFQTKHNVFPELITKWLNIVNISLSTIFYEDLSDLIKKYL